MGQRVGDADGEPGGSLSSRETTGGTPAPHPAEWLVTVEVHNRGRLVKKVVTLVHRGCELQGRVTDQGTQEELPW